MKMNSSSKTNGVSHSSTSRPSTTSSSSTTTTGYRASQWISYSNSSKSLVSNGITNVFKAVYNHPCNLISIFGRARQGKSFLMNCLAGETEIFRIDISNKWLSLSEFRAINNNISNSNSKPRSTTQPVGLTTQPSLLQQLLNDIYSKMMSLIGGINVYGADCHEVVDAERILTTRFDALSEDIMRKNTARLEAARDEMNSLLVEATQRMERVVQDTMVERNSACSSGYKLSDIETALNRQYRNINSMLEEKLQSSPFRTQALQLFLDNCTNLSRVMTQQFHQNRQHAISTAVGDARNHLTVLLASFDTAKVWTTDDDGEMSLEMRRHALHSCLMKMTYHLKTTIIALVREWFDSMTADEQRSFESRIDDQFADPVTAFEDAAMIIEAERYAAAAQSVIDDGDDVQEEGDDEEVIEDGDDEDEGDDDDDGDEHDGSTVRLGGSSSKQLKQLSVEEQRRKAMDWATNQLGLSHTKSKRTSKAKVSKAAAAAAAVVCVCMCVQCIVHRYVTASVTSHPHSTFIHALCTYRPLQQC